MLKRMICNGFEIRIEVDKGSESQTKQNMAPNVGMNDVMALNVEREYDFECQLRSNNGSERRNWKYDEDSFEHWYWWVMALNAEQRCDDGSEHRN